MNRFAAVLVILLSLSGCKDGGILDYWERNGIAYDDIRAAQRRFAVFAEQAAAAPEKDAEAAIDGLFDMLQTDTVAYYIYSEWMTVAFYSPFSPCRNSVLFAKVAGRLISDGIYSEYDCFPLRLKLEWMSFNLPGEKAVVPSVNLDGRRTLVLVLDQGCPSCRAHLGELSSAPEWGDVRRVALCIGSGPSPDVPGWEYFFPEEPAAFFDPEQTPVYYVVSPDSLVEIPYTAN